jgi:hypothetical protein
MRITESREKPKAVVISAKSIPPGTVFTGRIDNSDGPWYKTLFWIINLRQCGESYTTSDKPVDKQVYGYEPREAELILR